MGINKMRIIMESPLLKTLGIVLQSSSRSTSTPIAGRRKFVSAKTDRLLLPVFFLPLNALPFELL